MASEVFSFEEILAGNDRAVAKAISVIENDSSRAPELLEFLATIPKQAHRIGFTGPQWSGKSTLLGCIAEKWLSDEIDLLPFSTWQNHAMSPPIFPMTRKKIGIIAVDPTSPVTGGAFLGDRIRMPQRHIGERFFFRSMATRGNEHGFVSRLNSLMDILDAAGKDIVVVETTGVSQTEIAVRQYVATLVLVLGPTGDEVSFSKAGLMEVADVIIMNRGDLPEADSSFRALCEALNTETTIKGWGRSAFRTSATLNQGIQEVVAAIQAHREFLEQRA